jgi:hypothetical protein
MTTEPFAVKWPYHYEPRNCPIHVQNELDMAAPQDRVWAWLIRAPHWPFAVGQECQPGEQVAGQGCTHAIAKPIIKAARITTPIKQITFFLVIVFTPFTH